MTMTNVWAQSYEDYTSDEPDQHGLPDGLSREQYEALQALAGPKDPHAKKFAMEQLLREMGSIAGALEGRAARLREFRELVDKQVKDEGLDVFADSAFLTNAVRELLDSQRQNVTHDLCAAIQFATTVQFGRP